MKSHQILNDFILAAWIEHSLRKGGQVEHAVGEYLTIEEMKNIASDCVHYYLDLYGEGHSAELSWEGETPLTFVLHVSLSEPGPYIPYDKRD